MKTKYWLLVLVASILTSTAPVWADGDFYVIAGGGGGVGTKISSLPYTISAPGFYYVTGNLTGTGNDNGITVNSDDVTIDLMGFCLLNPGGQWTGIRMDGRKNVEFRNGTLSNWDYGINEQDSNGPPGGSGAYHRIINVRVKGRWPMHGIYLAGSGHLVKGCMISDAYEGIFANGSTITGNQVFNCQYGISDGGGDNAGTTSNNLVTNSSVSGISVKGTITGNTVNKCGTGIECIGDAIIVGNTVANCGTGINLNSGPILVDRNTVSGSGAHYSNSGNAVWGINAGRP